MTGCGGGSGGGGGGGGGGNSTPSIASISPTSASQGGQAFTLSVNGSGFVSGSQVLWNQTALTTTYTSSSQLTAQVPATDLASQGTFSIAVSNPSGGGTSSSVDFSVGNPLPVLTSIQPTSASAGSAAINLTVNGSNFLSASQVEWNNTALTTTYVNATTLTAQIPASDLGGAATNVLVEITVVNPSPGGGTSSPTNFDVLAPLTYFQTINVQANDIVWDPTHSLIYASLPSSDTNGNSVVAINPVNGSSGTPQPAGSEPDVLALSDDGSFLYVGLDGSGSVARFNLPALTLDPTLGIQLPPNTRGQTSSILALAVAPGSPHTVAVDPSYRSLAVYDDSTMRPEVPPYQEYEMTDVVWGANSSVLYSDGISGGASVMTVTSSGISSVSDLTGDLYGTLYYDAPSGLLYSDLGGVLNPANDNLPGNFDLYSLSGPYDQATALCLPDLEHGIVYFLGQTPQQSGGPGVTIQAYSASTYTLLTTLIIHGPTGYPARFLRWGNSGLAFLMEPFTDSIPQGGSQIYLIDGNFVNQQQLPDFTTGTPMYTEPSLVSISPQSAIAGASGFTLTVTGDNFFPTTKVLWGGIELTTTYVSNTELQAAVSPGNLADPGNAAISVIDGVTGLSSPASVVFTVLSAANSTTTIIPVNLAALKVAWDKNSQQLLLPVWSADTQYPNTVLGINPSNGAVAHMAQVQTDPYAFGATDDGSYVYTGFGALNNITRLSLPALDSPMTFTIPTNPEWGPLSTLDLRPEPGASQTIAADYEGAVPLPPSAGVTIFDNGVARSQSASSGVGEEGPLEWGVDNTQLYSAIPTTSGWAFETFNVSNSGLTFPQTTDFGGNPWAWGGLRIHFDSTTGYLYDDSGTVYDPATNTIVGNYTSLAGFVAVDATLNRVFILESGTGGGYAIASFNKTTFSPVSALGLPDLIGEPWAFIRWGSNGLAIVTNNPNSPIFNPFDKNFLVDGPAGMLYIINDTQFVSANANP